MAMQAIVDWEYIAVDDTGTEHPDPNLVVADVACVATTGDGQLRMFRKEYTMRRETFDVLRTYVAGGAHP